MLSLTPAAATHLAALRAIPQLQPDKVVRFVFEDDAIQMVADREKEGDVALKHEDETVLLLDESVSTKLKNLTLDVARPGGEPRLFLKPSDQ